MPDPVSAPLGDQTGADAPPPTLWLPLPHFPGSPVVLKLMLKQQTERRAFLREYCIALCLSSHAACLRTLPIAFESATHFAFGQELAPAGDLCALLNPGVRAALGLCGRKAGAEGWEGRGEGARTALQWVP